MVSASVGFVHFCFFKRGFAFLGAVGRWVFPFAMIGMEFAIKFAPSVQHPLVCGRRIVEPPWAAME